MIVRPFRGLRPRNDLADSIASPPYDVLSSEEARQLARGNPNSFLHVIKPEIDLDPRTDPYDDRVYSTGAGNLRAMIDDGRMVRDEAPAYYIYRLVMDDRTQTGVVGAAAVRDYLDGRIKKHEFTRPDKEKDRIRLNDALDATPGPIFLTYRSIPELNALVNGQIDRTPDVDFVAPDGVQHTLWKIDDPAICSKIETLFSRIRATYVADGHHRSAAAAKLSEQRIAEIDEPTGEEPVSYFMAVHFPADQLHVLDYNRVVADLNGLDPEALVARIEDAGFHVQPDWRTRKPPHRGSFGMYVDGRWSLLTAKPEIVPEDDVVGRLDVSILTTRLLQPILGIGDPRTDKRIDFVGGIRGMQELEKRVDSGRDAIAFSLWPTSLDEVMAVADAGQVMPPKSTWFEPKLRSGLVVQLFEGDRL
ncbi:MAG: DUF1015 family protein [Acidobacteria bacterium]|nr:DUF1015 family protein [Acidobacteriota bacterium]NIM63726.1 DUF1015 family protein [Acidobacteriota bacterium]NIO60111.1 DUF1015 family protein [Acidobacteriota bacterium]NIQ31182.1 DUF1015 family protein [Acidobacteriota bacterium]NIQ86311.1 DUF1015 family protein [Acidobacteriota bacterium]